VVNLEEQITARENSLKKIMAAIIIRVVSQFGWPVVA
jgi:hypothetical protein